MAIIVERKDGEWHRFAGTPQLNAAKVARLVDGGVWTEADLALHGLAVAEPFAVPAGQVIDPTGQEGFEERNGKVYQVLGTRSAPRRRVRKSTIIARLTDEQLVAALEILTPRQMERWRAPDQPTVYYDDPETVAVLTAIGADPAEVMREGDDP